MISEVRREADEAMARFQAKNPGGASKSKCKIMQPSHLAILPSFPLPQTKLKKQFLCKVPCIHNP